MNLPNKLTLIRALMVPFFVFFLLLSPTHENYNYIAIAIFIIASSTDFLDGHIARKYNLVTNFGKFMDPLADKLLVCSALICLSSLGMLNTVVVIIIISREFIITGFRTVASDAGIVIAASKYGKLKTATQMVMIPYVMLNLQGDVFNTIKIVLVTITLIFTIYSAFDYIYLNRDVLKA